MWIFRHDIIRRNISGQSAIALFVTVAGLVLTLTTVVAALTPEEKQQAGEQCILCHVEAYNSTLVQAVIHTPFWDRECTTCHLPAGSSWPGTDTTAVENLITGTPVEQEILWRKQETFGSDVRGFAHLVSLSGLKSSTTYRFRLRVAEESSKPLAGTLWLGLRSSEIPIIGKERELSVTEGLDPAEAYIKNLVIRIINTNTAVLSWQTLQPVYSWVELQELSSQEQTAIAEKELLDQRVHPPLRDPKDLSISSCYQCHPESTLGTSHPVRLYGGQDVRIPEELPTVDGMLTCVTCHDPHGAPGKMLVRETIKTKLCVACHYKFKNSSPSTMFR